MLRFGAAENNLWHLTQKLRKITQNRQFFPCKFISLDMNLRHKAYGVRRKGKTQKKNSRKVVRKGLDLRLRLPAHAKKTKKKKGLD
jgi:hypothetical protein